VRKIEEPTARKVMNAKESRLKEIERYFSAGDVSWALELYPLLFDGSPTAQDFAALLCGEEMVEDEPWTVRQAAVILKRQKPKSRPAERTHVENRLRLCIRALRGIVRADIDLERARREGYCDSCIEEDAETSAHNLAWEGLRAAFK